jgi:hypothetical protein
MSRPTPCVLMFRTTPDGPLKTIPRLNKVDANAFQIGHDRSCLINIFSQGVGHAAVVPKGIGSALRHGADGVGADQGLDVLTSL